MAKVTISKSFDIEGNPLIILRKNNGRISMREAYESLEKEHLYGQYIIRMPVTENVPEDLYEEGDTWEIYNIETFMDVIADDKIREGYEMCMQDHNLKK